MNLIKTVSDKYPVVSRLQFFSIHHSMTFDFGDSESYVFSLQIRRVRIFFRNTSISPLVPLFQNSSKTSLKQIHSFELSMHCFESQFNPKESIYYGHSSKPTFVLKCQWLNLCMQITVSVAKLSRKQRRREQQKLIYFALLLRIRYVCFFFVFLTIFRIVGFFLHRAANEGK